MHFIAILLAAAIFANYFPEDVQAVIRSTIRRIKPDFNTEDLDLRLYIRAFSKIAIGLFFFSSFISIFKSNSYSSFKSDQSVLVEGDILEIHHIIERGGEFNSAKRVLFLDQTRSIASHGNVESLTSANQLDEKADFLIIYFDDKFKDNLKEQKNTAKDTIEKAIGTVATSLKASGTIVFAFNSDMPFIEGLIRVSMNVLKTKLPNEVKATCYDDKLQAPSLILDCIVSTSSCALRDNPSRELQAIMLLSQDLLPFDDIYPGIVVKVQEARQYKQLSSSLNKSLFWGGNYPRFNVFEAKGSPAALTSWVFLTMKAYFKSEKELTLWHKYWIIFAGVCIVEDMVFVNLYLIFFIPFEFGKMIFLAKCLYPSPKAAEKVYDKIAQAIENTFRPLRNVVKDEWQKQNLVNGNVNTSDKDDSSRGSNSESDYPEPTEEEKDIISHSKAVEDVNYATASAYSVKGELRRRTSRRH